MGYTVWNLTQGGASGWCGDYATKEGAIVAVTRWRRAWPRAAMPRDRAQNRKGEFMDGSDYEAGVKAAMDGVFWYENPTVSAEWLAGHDSVTQAMQRGAWFTVGVLEKRAARVPEQTIFLDADERN